MRGYCGIGIYRSKKETNLGTLLRSANCFGVDFIFTIGRRYDRQIQDTMQTPRHVPVYHHQNYTDFLEHIPMHARIVCIERCEGSTDIKNFTHPDQAIYLLGAEDHGLPKEIIEKYPVVHIESEQCLNVAVAGSIVLFDRQQKRGAK